MRKGNAIAGIILGARQEHRTQASAVHIAATLLEQHLQAFKLAIVYTQLDVCLFTF